MIITEKFEFDGQEVTGHFSVEHLQDVEIQMRLLRQFRTTEITEEEIAAWKTIYFGLDPVKPGEYNTDPECVTWREILGCTGPGFRCPILTDEITQQEIDDWGAAYTKFKNIDFDEVRKKYNVKFESDEPPPYPEYEDFGWGCSKPAQPVQWPPESTIFPWVEDLTKGKRFPLDGDINFFANPETYGPRS
jgi:hypothetical protein